VSFDSSLLDIVCCPVTHQPLQLLAESKLALLNERIAAQSLKHRDDTLVPAPLEQALVTRDGRLAYPVRDGIPILLEPQGILLTQITDP
jgi:uncharacterized protein YbaR (Trm112 family)